MTPGAAQDKSLDELLHDIDSLRAATENWEESKKRQVEALVSAVDALNREAIVRLVRAVRSDSAGAGLLRESLADRVVYAVLRHHGIIKASLQERIEEALASVRPMIKEHGGDVELVGVESNDTAVVRLSGACDGCPASQITLSEGIESAIKGHCPEITKIRQVAGKSFRDEGVQIVSPFARSSEGSSEKKTDV